ncbi:lipoprotein [Spiroplasma endosymbiont of Nebria brevicollis]|uniref:lipoprotein n=1 Tax=Spiroplasma endosymbiont of Nebria brevicollis TaxID=3066284 RepID=UPI00313BA03A
MRKLLSLLTVLTLTTPVPLNVIACGGTKTPPVVDETDYLTLAQTAKAKIQTEFANLVNEGLNLRKVGDVTGGDAIMTYLRGTKKDTDTDTRITEKTSKETFTGFLEVLTAQVLKISNNLLSNYPELKPLFNGINPNDILKINTKELDNLLTNKRFDWKNNDFGFTGFNAEKEPYEVTDWYHITANLKLDFTCFRWKCQ